MRDQLEPSDRPPDSGTGGRTVDIRDRAGSVLRPARRREFLRRAAIWLGASVLAPWVGERSAFASGTDLYVVKSGDTLSEIAAQHDVSLGQLRSLNGIKSDHIRPGQRLRIRVTPTYPLIEPMRASVALSNVNRSRWRHIILHHSATAGGNAAMFDQYHRRTRHMENGLAYHFLIGNGTDSPDGGIEIGPRWTRQIQGGHVRSLVYNENSIGICLVGDFERTRPTSKQLAASIELVGFLRQSVLQGTPKLLVHRELKGEHTLCPGRNFPLQRFSRFRA